MAVREFDGELDSAPSVSVREFSGQLDGEQPGLIDREKKAVSWNAGRDFVAPEGVTEDTFSAGVPDITADKNAVNLPGSVMDGYVPPKVTIEEEGSFAAASQKQRAMNDAAQARANENVLKEAPPNTDIVRGLATGLKTDIGKATSVPIRAVGKLIADEAIGNQELQSAGQAIEGAGKNLWERYSKEEARNQPQFESVIGRGLYGGARSLEQMLAAIVTAGGNPAGTLAAMVGPLAATEAGNALSQGKSLPTAIAYGLGQGGLEYITEKLPMNFLMTKLGKAGFKDLVTGFIGRELPSEQLATLTQDALQKATLEPEKTWAQYIAERPEAALETAIATGVMVGGVGALHGAARAIQPSEADAAEQAKQRAMSAWRTSGLAPSAQSRQRAESAPADTIKPSAEVLSAPTLDEAIESASAAVSGPVYSPENAIATFLDGTIVQGRVTGFAKDGSTILDGDDGLTYHIAHGEADISPVEPPAAIPEPIKEVTNAPASDQGTEAVPQQTEQSQAPAAADVAQPIQQPIQETANAQEAPAETAEVLKAYSKGYATQLANRLTKQGKPSEVFPSPTVEGKFSVREVKDGAVAPSQADAEMASSGTEAAGSELAGSGNVLASAPTGNAGRTIDSAEVAKSSMRPAVSTGTSGASGVAPNIAQTELPKLQPESRSNVEVTRQQTQAQPVAPVQSTFTPAESKRIKPITQWTADDLQARLDRGGLKEESRQKIESQLESVRRIGAEKNGKSVAQADRVAKMRAAKEANKGTFLVGPDKDSAERVSVRDGVVHLGDYPANDYETGDDITVPEGATKQQIFDALIAGKAITNNSKIFGKNGPEQSVAERIAALDNERAAMSKAGQRASSAVEAALNIGVNEDGNTEAEILAAIGANHEEINQADRSDEESANGADAGAESGAGGSNQERSGNAPRQGFGLAGQAKKQASDQEPIKNAEPSAATDSPKETAAEQDLIKKSSDSGYNDIVAGTQAPTSAGDGSTGSAKQPHVAVAEQVLSLMDDQTYDYGLRVLPDDFTDSIKRGESLSSSLVWEDGDITDEEIDGVSTAGIRRADLGSVLAAMRNLGVTGKNGPNGYYFGSRVVLVRGEGRGSGQDVGERIIRGAEVIGEWRKPTNGLSEVKPNEPSASAGSDASNTNILESLENDKERAARKAIDRAIAIEQGLDVPPVKRESARLRIATLRKQLESGKIDQDGFVSGVEALHARMEEAAANKKHGDVPRRTRGADYIRQRLLEAKRRGDISSKASDFAEWFILKNPSLLDDLGISVRAAPAEGRSAGNYNPFNRVATLFSGSAGDTTAVHETLHHFERMMPAEMQNEIRSEWLRAVTKEMEKPQGPRKLYLEKIIAAHTTGFRPLLEEAGNMIKKGIIPYADYQYMNASEFWAVRMTSGIAARYAAKDSIWKRAAQWLREAIQHIRGALGLRSDAPLLRALDSILEGNGEFASEEMLTKAPEYNAPKNPIAGDRFTLPGETGLQKTQRLLQDSANRWNVAQNAVKEQGGIIDDTTDVAGAIERYPGRVGAAFEAFNHGTVEPLLERMAAEKVTMEQVAAYLYALHAPERNAKMQEKNPRFKQGNGSGMLDKDAADIVRDFQALPNFAEIDRLARDFQALTDRRISLLVNSGAMSQDQADAYRKTYEFYVPLKGFEVLDEDGKPTGAGTGQGFSTGGRIDKHALGRGSKAGQIIENIIRDYEAAIVLAEKVHVGKIARNFVQANADDKLWEIDNPPLTQVLMPGKVAYHVDYFGSHLATFANLNDARDHVKQLRLKFGVTPNDTVVRPVRAQPQVASMAAQYDPEAEIRFLEDGKQVRVQLHDKGLLRAYNTLGRKELDVVSKLFNTYNSWLRQMYTQKNPAWFLLNFLKDQQSAVSYLTGEQGAAFAGKAMTNIPSALGAAWNMYHKKPAGPQWAQLIDEFRQHGGVTGFAYVGDIEAKSDQLHGALAKYQSWSEARGQGMRGILAKSMNNKFFDYIEAYNTTFENATRLAAFKTARDSGMSPEQSASLAKNVTVNFNRKGEFGSVINAWFLFSNAGIQGSRNIGHALFFSPHRKQVWALASGMVAMGVMAGLMGDDDDDLVSDSTRSRALATKWGMAKIILPLAYGWGWFFSIGQLIGQSMKHPDKREKIALKMASLTFDHFGFFGNPVAGDQLSLKTAVANTSPTAIRPIVQNALNTSSFGGPIYPEGHDETTPDSEKAWRKTRGTAYDQFAKWMNSVSGGDVAQAGIVSVSPESLKQMVSTLGGGALRLVADMISLPFEATREGEIKAKNVPVLKNFYQAIDVDDYRRRFNDQAEKATEAYQISQGYKRAGKKQGADKSIADERAAFMAEENALVYTGRMVEMMRKQISGLRDHEDQIRNDKSLQQGVRKAKLQNLERQEIAIMNQFDETIRRINKTSSR